MNGKKARALRKEVSFKPSNGRVYQEKNLKKYVGDLVTSTVYNDPQSLRGQYQRAKKVI